jgi:hypothetical protein
MAVGMANVIPAQFKATPQIYFGPKSAAASDAL